MVEINQEGVITDMFVKKFKRKCSVRGCKNVADVYLISRRRDMGNTVAMCRECLQDALASIDGYQEPEKVIKVDRPLFYHPEETKVTLSSVAEKEPEPVEVIEKVTEEDSISVAEDTVTITKEETPIETPKPKATSTNKANTKKKTNKKR